MSYLSNFIDSSEQINRQEKILEQLNILSVIADGDARKIEGTDELILPSASERTKAILLYDLLFRKNNTDKKINENFGL